jgi:cation diffusion facilitator family transporter
MDALESRRHTHRYGADGVAEGERRARWVVAITLAMMAGEIVAGTLTGSMALLADGWHMGTHAAALGVAAFAYAYARRHADDARYSFGTGKVNALGGFASAVGLAVVALIVLGESVQRLASPSAIRFDEAIAVAVLGLAVNVGCALLLRDGHGHDHDHGHDHPHDGQGGARPRPPGHGGDGAHHADHHRRAAYLHVLADALTSVLAIVALTAGRTLGWSFLDPVMGIVGALVIARWSVALLRDTAAVLLDAEAGAERRRAIVAAIERDGAARVADLHVWRVGPRHLATIVSVVSAAPEAPDRYRERLRALPDLVHVTVEVNAAAERTGAAG